MSVQRFLLATADRRLHLLFKSRGGLQLSSKSLPNHSVLSIQDYRMASQRYTNLLHLLRADVVHADNKTFWILLKEFSKFGEVLGLPGRAVFSHHLSGARLPVGFKDLEKSKLIYGSNNNIIKPTATKLKMENNFQDLVRNKFKNEMLMWPPTFEHNSSG